MITVGYGDVTPQTIYERLICVGVMMITCAVFAYIKFIVFYQD